MIVITWTALTQYAARCIGAFVRKSDEEVVVVSTRVNTPVSGIDDEIGKHVVWIDRNDERSIADVVGGVPRAIVASWSTPCFYRWAKEVKKNAGIVVLPADEAYLKFPFKELLRCLRYRLKYLNFFDKVFVCGKGGRQLFRFYGVKDANIYEGLCAGDPQSFFNGDILSERPKRFVYVGRLIALKNIVAMCKAFSAAWQDNQDWCLDIYGDGPLKGSLPLHPAIHVHHFETADNLGAVYRNSQCLILGSLHDNWGVVVHEAAMCGCMLLLSDRVGARYDFATKENAVVFRSTSTTDFESAMRKIMGMNADEKQRAQKISLELARKFSPAFFAQSMGRMVEREDVK